MSPPIDILIVGGGLQGTLLQLALQSTSYRVILCEASDLHAKTRPESDPRAIALNKASRRILTALDVWPALAPFATPLQRILISSQGQFGRSELNATPSEPLGHVLAMHHFYQAILPLLPAEQIHSHTRLVHFHAPSREVTLETRTGERVSYRPQLIVAADGSRSSLLPFVGLPLQVPPSTQVALLCQLNCVKPHGYTAYERFTADGPLACLPVSAHEFSLVWCGPPDKVRALQQASESEFLSHFQATLAHDLGPLAQLSSRVSVPLQPSFLPIPYTDSVVFIGNAAQTLHPIAGQGFNLGLRDLAHLVQCLLQAPPSPALLQHYYSLRASDRKHTIQATQALLALFQTPRWPFRTARSVGLAVFEQLSPLKNTLIRYASGLGDRPPDLACGVSPDPNGRLRRDICWAKAQPTTVHR